MSIDQDLLAAYLQRQDPTVFTTLMDRHSGMVFTTCLRVAGNHSDAEDACQECFLALMRQAHSIRGNLAAWLHETARRSALRMVARRRKLGPLVEETAAPPTEEASGLCAAVDAALARLPEREREAVVLNVLERRNQTEIASDLGVSQPTVHRLIQRAFERLRTDRLLTKAAQGAIVPAAWFATLPVATPSPALTVQLGKLALSALPVATGKTLLGATVLIAIGLVAVTSGAAVAWFRHEPAAAIVVPTPQVAAPDRMVAQPPPAPSVWDLPLSPQARAQLDTRVWRDYAQAYPVEIALDLLRRTGVRLDLPYCATYRGLISIGGSGATVQAIVEATAQACGLDLHPMEADRGGLRIALWKRMDDAEWQQLSAWARSAVFSERRHAAFRIGHATDPRVIALLPELLLDAETPVRAHACLALQRWQSFLDRSDDTVRLQVATALRELLTRLTHAEFKAQMQQLLPHLDPRALETVADLPRRHTLQAKLDDATQTTDLRARLQTLVLGRQAGDKLEKQDQILLDSVGAGLAGWYQERLGQRPCHADELARILRTMPPADTLRPALVQLWRDTGDGPLTEPVIEAMRPHLEHPEVLALHLQLVAEPKRRGAQAALANLTLLTVHRPEVETWVRGILQPDPDRGGKDLSQSLERVRADPLQRGWFILAVYANEQYGLHTKRLGSWSSTLQGLTSENRQALPHWNGLAPDRPDEAWSTQIFMAPFPGGPTSEAWTRALLEEWVLDLSGRHAPTWPDQDRVLIQAIALTQALLRAQGEPPLRSDWRLVKDDSDLPIRPPAQRNRPLFNVSTDRERRYLKEMMESVASIAGEGDDPRSGLRADLNEAEFCNALDHGPDELRSAYLLQMLPVSISYYGTWKVQERLTPTMVAAVQETLRKDVRNGRYRLAVLLGLGTQTDAVARLRQNLTKFGPFWGGLALMATEDPTVVDEVLALIRKEPDEGARLFMSWWASMSMQPAYARIITEAGHKHHLEDPSWLIFATRPTASPGPAATKHGDGF